METTKSTSSQNNKRIAKNTLMLYFRMILTMSVTLYTSRVIINTLGVEDYGIYSIVGGVVAMFSFFNSAMTSATQRFLSYEIGKGDLDRLTKTFNAAQIIHIGIAILLFILAETVGLWFLKTYLVIPAERMEAALWVYHFAVLSFMISIIQVPYNAIIIAHERMNVYAYVSILEVALKLLIVFMLTWIVFDKLKLYAVLYFSVVFIIALIYRVYTRKRFEESKFELVKDKKLYKTLVSYSGWSMYGAIARVTQGQGINILLNIFFGPILNAARGISTQVQGAVSSFVSNFQTAVRPQIIKSHSAGEKGYMTSLTISSSKFSFYLLFLLALPLMVEVDQILELWLKTVPDYAPIFTLLILIVALTESISGSLVAGVQATGKIRTYQIVVGSLYILILPSSYVFLKFGYPPEVTLYITIGMEVIVLIFRVFYLKAVIDFPVVRFIKDVIIPSVLIVLLSVPLPLYLRNMMDQSFARLTLVVFTSLICSAVATYVVGLSKSEKMVALKGVNKLLKLFK